MSDRLPAGVTPADIDRHGHAGRMTTVSAEAQADGETVRFTFDAPPDISERRRLDAARTHLWDQGHEIVDHVEITDVRPR